MLEKMNTSNFPIEISRNAEDLLISKLRRKNNIKEIEKKEEIWITENNSNSLIFRILEKINIFWKK